MRNSKMYFYLPEYQVYVCCKSTRNSSGGKTRAIWRWQPNWRQFREKLAEARTVAGSAGWRQQRWRQLLHKLSKLLHTHSKK